MKFTSAGFRKLLIGTTTVPASRIPKKAGTNSGQFFSHKPTRSPGFTPNCDFNRSETKTVTSQSFPYEYSCSPQYRAIFSRCLLADAANAEASFIPAQDTNPPFPSKPKLQ